MDDRIECPTCKCQFMANYKTCMGNDKIIVGNKGIIYHTCPECASKIEVRYYLQLDSYRLAPTVSAEDVIE